MSESSGLEIPAWKLSHYLKKLRLALGWSIDECAYHASLRPIDIISVEDGEPCSHKALHDHILKLENAFGIDILKTFNRMYRPKEQSDDTSLILPFVTPEISIHQNSMEWSRDGVLKDAVELAPHLAVLPQGMIKKFIGLKIPSNFLEFLKQKTRARITRGIQSPHTLFGHYRRLIHASAQSEYTPPLRYEAKLNGSDGTVTREVTCVKLASNAFETQTRVISKQRKIQRAFVDVSCCREFNDCSECYIKSLAALLKLSA